MINYPLSEGYKTFSELFGLRTHDNGNKSRKNVILLSYWKSKPVREYLKQMGCERYSFPTSMSLLKDYCLAIFNGWSFNKNLNHIMKLKGRVWFSNQYETDHMKGKTEDGDSKSIRYVKAETGHVYKMKAGKMYRNLILETAFGKVLPEQVLVWLCEELAMEWAGYNIKSDYELHVDGNFAKIYDSCHLLNDFGSCMVDRDQHSFYEDSVKAKAAYITNKSNKILARAIIFEEVKDEDNRTWRLCERQYSSNGDEILKQVLVNKLIEGGYIDGYKKVGADCHNAVAFLDNFGQSLSHKSFRISCNLEADDVLSYQDSFKWFDADSMVAYNYKSCNYTDMLDTTDSHFNPEGQNYDDYHECYTRSATVCVSYHGNWINCAENDLDDFRWVESEQSYYHEDDVEECPECGEYYIDDNGEYSEVTDKYYCCEDCKENAEGEYCKEHPDEYIWNGNTAILKDEAVWCVDTQRYMKNEDAYWSEFTEKYYEYWTELREDEKKWAMEHSDEYTFLNGKVVANEDVWTCPHCGEKYARGDGFASAITGMDYCCRNCRNGAEYQFAEKHPDDYFIGDGIVYPISATRTCICCGERFVPLLGHKDYYETHSQWVCNYRCAIHLSQSLVKTEVEQINLA